jgi:transcription elongation factor GreA
MHSLACCSFLKLFFPETRKCFEPLFHGGNKLFTQYLSHFNDRLGRFARQHYLQLPINTNQAELSKAYAASAQDTGKRHGSVKRIKLGDKVTLFDVNAKEVITLVLVSPRNSNPERGRISCFSPLGRQLIGRAPGDVIEVKIFYRTEMFRVVRIEH